MKYYVIKALNEMKYFWKLSAVKKSGENISKWYGLGNFILGREEKGKENDMYWYCIWECDKKAWASDMWGNYKNSSDKKGWECNFCGDNTHHRVKRSDQQVRHGDITHEKVMKRNEWVAVGILNVTKWEGGMR